MNQREKRVFRIMVLVTVALLVFAAIGMAGCSSEPPVEKGYLVKREFKPAHWEDGYRTEYRSQYRCRTVTSYSNGKSTSSQQCSTEMVPYQVYEDHHTYVEDRWRFRLRDCDDKDDEGKTVCREGWKEVSRAEYDRYTLGHHYPDAR